MRLMLIGRTTVWIELDGLGLLTGPWIGSHGLLEHRLASRIVPPTLAPGEIRHARAET